MASIFEKIADQMLGKSKPEDITQASDQSPDEQKLIAYIKQKVDEVRTSGSRVAYEAIWLTNVAYLLGFSGVAYDPIQRIYKNTDPGTRNYRRTRNRVNKVLPTCQNRLARLTKSPPKYDVRPESNSSEDKDATRLGLQIIEDVYDKQQFNLKRQELKMACQQYGYAFGQVNWDPCLGKPILDPETGKFTGEYEGDIRIDILSPFEVFTDPLAKTMEECQWWCKAKVRKLSYFKERYPRGHLVKEEDAWLMSTQYEQRINSLTASGITGSSTSTQMKDAAIEIVYYEKKSKHHPNGRMITIASGILLDEKELPIGEFDLTKFDDIIVQGKFQSEAVITHLRPVQDHYNLTVSKRADWMRKLLAGKYIVPRGSGLEQEALNNESGEVLYFNPVPGAAAPQPLQIPNIPQYAYTEEEKCNEQFDFISGINEISRGTLPSAGIPAAGMQFLQEQDETRIGVITMRDELGYASIARHILMYASEYYKMPRYLKIAGEGLEYTIKEFIGADLRNNFDVICIPGSTTPSSKVLRRQDILNAYYGGLLGNPQDPRLQQKVLKMIEFGDNQEMWKTQALTEAQIKRTINDIEQGKTPPLEELDNHSMFVQELNDYRMTDKYFELDPRRQELLKYVIEWHIQAEVRLKNPGLADQQMLSEEMLKSSINIPENVPTENDIMNQNDGNQEGSLSIQPEFTPAV